MRVYEVVYKYICISPITSPYTINMPVKMELIGVTKYRGDIFYASGVIEATKGIKITEIVSYRLLRG